MLRDGGVVEGGQQRDGGEIENSSGDHGGLQRWSAGLWYIGTGSSIILYNVRRVHVLHTRTRTYSSQARSIVPTYPKTGGMNLYECSDTHR
jgi:hypothetical protein